MNTTPQATTTQPRISDLIHFHGLTLLVVTANNVQYVQAKPLAELAGLVWRSAKNTILEGDNALLYGAALLKTPLLHANLHTSMQKNDLETGENEVSGNQNTDVYIRLDRARMYLARINTKHMRNKGNIEAAEALLKLQQEWAQVLHDYETKGIASKNNSFAQKTQLLHLIKAYPSATTAHKALLDGMIADASDALGYSTLNPNNQQLPLFKQES